MLQNELVSVIMPVYNSEKYVGRAVDSILAQSYSNLEFIIVDDGSTDGTLSILKQYNDNRIKLFERDHEGIVAQLNFGLGKVSGKYTARMDADDTCREMRIEKQLKFLQANTDYILAGSNVNYIDKNGKVLVYKRFPESHEAIEYMMPILTAIAHPSIMTYTETLKKLNGYRKECEYVEDYDLYLRMISNGFKLYNIQEPLCGMRIHGESVSYINLQHQKKLIYDLGSEYLNRKYREENNEFDFLFRMGLLEFYNNDLQKARSYFLQSLKVNRKEWKKISRYFIVTLLGKRFLTYLRRKRILNKLSGLSYKLFGYDTHIIRK